MRVSMWRRRLAIVTAVSAALVLLTVCIGTVWSITIAFGVLIFVGVANVVDVDRFVGIQIPRMTFLDWCVLAVVLSVLYGLVAPATVIRS
jgi:hypothetical protein